MKERNKFLLRRKLRAATGAVSGMLLDREIDKKDYNKIRQSAGDQFRKIVEKQTEADYIYRDMLTLSRYYGEAHDKTRFLSWPEIEAFLMKNRSMIRDDKEGVSIYSDMEYFDEILEYKKRYPKEYAKVIDFFNYNSKINQDYFNAETTKLATKLLDHDEKDMRIVADEIAFLLRSWTDVYDESHGISVVGDWRRLSASDIKDFMIRATYSVADSGVATWRDKFLDDNRLKSAGFSDLRAHKAYGIYRVIKKIIEYDHESAEFDYYGAMGLVTHEFVHAMRDVGALNHVSKCFYKAKEKTRNNTFAHPLVEQYTAIECDDVWQEVQAYKIQSLVEDNLRR